MCVGLGLRLVFLRASIYFSIPSGKKSCRCSGIKLTHDVVGAFGSSAGAVNPLDAYPNNSGHNFMPSIIVNTTIIGTKPVLLTPNKVTPGMYYVITLGPLSAHESTPGGVRTRKPMARCSRASQQSNVQWGVRFDPCLLHEFGRRLLNKELVRSILDRDKMRPTYLRHRCTSVGESAHDISWPSDHTI